MRTRREPREVVELLLRAADDASVNRPELAYSLARAAEGLRELAQTDRRFDMPTWHAFILEAIPKALLRRYSDAQANAVGAQLGCFAAELREKSTVRPKTLDVRGAIEACAAEEQPVSKDLERKGGGYSVPVREPKKPRGFA